MNFFEHQNQAKKNTKIMFFLFFLAIIAIVITVDVVSFYIFRSWIPEEFMLKFLIISSVFTVFVIVLGSLYQIIELRDGGEVVARQAGGTLIDTNSQDFYVKRLRNVVEEISIASGVPVPKIFILSNEEGINAFAAGFSTNDAAIAVTRGALEKLNRDELQSVIAHEFSHILNGDMRINIVLMGLLHGILLLSLIGRKFLYGGENARIRGSGPILFMGIALFLIGSVGVFFGRMIKSYVSRQREYLADASAIQFTRQSDGLSGALKKIAGIHEGSSFKNKESAEMVSHMLFGSGFSSSWLFSTHPPLADRLSRIDPTFRPSQIKDLKKKWFLEGPNGLEEDVRLGFISIDQKNKEEKQSFIKRSIGYGSDGKVIGPYTGHSKPKLITNIANTVNLDDSSTWSLEEDGDISNKIGISSIEDYDYAKEIIESIAPVFEQASRQTHKVMPLMYALLLSKNPVISSKQKIYLAQSLNSSSLALVKQLQDDMPKLNINQRLPLISIALSTLSKFPEDHLRDFKRNIQSLIEVDGKVSAFEYCLSRLIIHSIRMWSNPSIKNTGSKNIEDLKSEITLLLNVIAKNGHKDQNLSRYSFASGFSYLFEGSIPTYDENIDILKLDAIWEGLNTLSPHEKRKVIESIVSVIIEDGKLENEEHEMLRLVCSILECPLPILF